jgi:ribosome-associated protein
MQQLEFKLDGDFIELNQLLKLAGLCSSGGAGKALVAQGGVRVNGQLETRKTCKIYPESNVRIGDVLINVVS